MRLKSISYITTLFLILVNTTFASAIEVAPTKVFFNQDQKFTFVTVKNLSNEKVFIQAELLSWQQDGNKNLYNPSHDMILSPPLFVIEAKSQQILRLGRKKLDMSPNTKETEQSYRLLLSELPDQFKNAKGLQMMLRLNLPIFIQPEKASNLELQWTKKIINNKDVQLTIYNPNNTHKMINKIELKDKLDKKLYDKQNAFIYLLPQQKYSWIVENNPKLVEHIRSDTQKNNQDLALLLNTQNGINTAIPIYDDREKTTVITQKAESKPSSSDVT